MTSIRQRLDDLPDWVGRLVQVGLPILLVALGGIVALVLILTREEAEMAESEARVIPVETYRATRGDQIVTIHATGRVRASRNVRLEPEVSGRITWVSPRLRPGGRFREGEMLARIDERDYSVAVERQQAAVHRAEVALRTEEGRKEIAEREWALLENVQTSDRGRSLALREPQLEEAEAQLKAARAALGQARLNVERTTIRAPFDLAINSESVDVGQVVRPGTPMADVLGARVFWIEVPVAIGDLPWLEIPGGRATVVHDLARGRRVEREGRIIDLVPSVEAGGMMARVLVAVDDPLDGATGDGAGGVDSEAVPLLMGAVVEVTLYGEEARSVYAVPRAALRREGTVWLASDSSTLRLEEVQVVHRGPETLFLEGPLGEEPRFVISMISTPVEGMAVMVQDTVSLP